MNKCVYIKDAFRCDVELGEMIIRTILAVRKAGHLNIKTKIFDIKARVTIGWLARVFVETVRIYLALNKI